MSTGLNDSLFYLILLLSFWGWSWKELPQIYMPAKALLESSSNCIPCCLNFLSFRVMGDDNSKMTV